MMSRFLSESGSAGWNELTVRAACGPLVGVDLGEGVAAFKGIRYGEPPVGERRWQPPRPALAWTEVRAAQAFGPACVQVESARGSVYAHPPRRVSEDCLFLNVWRPPRATNAPVMVWLHGGSLRTGDLASGMYDGERLARKGVLVVTVNYRLGVLGFLAHPGLSAESEHAASGNYGFLDQIEALRWVQMNIAAFGGDPHNVTLFGESAGALSTIALMTSPLAKGLFHRAIVQSGSLVSNSQLKRPVLGHDAGESVGARLAEKMGAAGLAALRAMDAGQLVMQAAAAGFNPRPVIDGWVLPRQLIECFDRGEQAAVPVIVGFNEGEIRSMRFFLPPLPQNAAQYEQQVRSVYRDLAPAYLARYPGSDIEQSALAAARDGFFGWTAERLARSQTRIGVPAYLYYFAHEYPAQKSLHLEAFHASELPYEFGKIGAPEGWPEHWPRPPDDAGERALSEAIMRYFTSFARTGVPSAAGAEEWRPYGEARAFLEIRAQPRLLHGLLPGMFELHEEVIARRRASATQSWYINVGLASPPVPPRGSEGGSYG